MDLEDGSLRPCEAFPIRGAVVCVKHGGGAPQVRAAAARRLQQSGAEQAVLRALDDPSATPVTDWVSELQALAGRVGNAVDAIGDRVNELQAIRYGSDVSTEQLRAEVDVWLRLIGQFRGLLVDMGRLDLGARELRLREQEVALLAGSVVALLGRLGRDDPGGREVAAAWLEELDAGRVLVAGEVAR